MVYVRSKVEEFEVLEGLGRPWMADVWQLLDMKDGVDLHKRAIVEIRLDHVL